MGVHGLWRLIEPSGKPVPLETLENKVLAVDVSIWLHQVVKGFQDSKGAPLPNAHLLGIYHRLCKLLYFRIKPVFVFDGGVPVLKKQTIAKRNQQKSKTLDEASRIHKNLLSTLLKHSAISKVLSEKAKAAITATSPIKKSKNEGDDDLYVLPPSQSLDSTISSGDESSNSDDANPPKQYDLHSIDTESLQFKSLPADVRHEILTDLKETRKQSSWGKIHELPTESDDFSIYQMRRLLKRQSVQTALEDVEKEMGGHSLSLGELEEILKDQGVITNTNIKGSRIASNENTRFLLIKDIKQAVEDAKKQNGLPTIEEKNEEGDSQKTEEIEETSDETTKNKGEIEFEDDLKKAIALSLEEEPSTSKQPEEKTKIVGKKGKKRMQLSFLENFEDADFGDSESSEEEVVQTKFTPAQRYMMEYSGLTPNEIAKIIASKSRANKKEEEKKATKPAIEKPPTVEEEPPTVEVMSDSDSSTGEDFLEVEEDKKIATESMEVVIKPSEEIEDDLFKDVFEEEEKSQVENKNATVAAPQIIEPETGEEIPLEKSVENVEKEVGIEDMEKEVGIEAMEKEMGIEDAEKSKDTANIEEPHNQMEVENMEKLVEESTNEELVPEKSSLKDNIGRMIKTYSRLRPNEETPKLSVEKMNEMRDNLSKEQAELVTERSNKERLAGNITDQMCQEAQELLELFGVPYLIAPMEAEAQCAFLDLINLTDGTITDDSDIWLFGGRTVYKNFFNQSKTVLEFKSEEIQHHFKLTREQMILLAMLVGSDYTTGLTGIGPVTALEILAAFPPKNQLLSGLAEFKSWFDKGKLPGPRRTSLRSKLKNVSFNENFPNPQIIQAYLEPRVETSEEKFSWAKPDVVGLVDFARQKFGWTKIKTEQILNPVLKRMEDHHKQTTIRDYFKSNFKIEAAVSEKQMSKRVKTALSRIGKSNVSDDEDEEKPKRKKKVTDDGPKAAKKKRVSTKKNTDEDLEVLKQTEARSKIRVEEIEKEISAELKEQRVKKVNLANLHKKEVIPQKQKDKTEMLRNKMKAIETFRKSKQGPGYVKKKGKVSRAPRNDAGYLSESSSD